MSTPTSPSNPNQYYMTERPEMQAAFRVQVPEKKQKQKGAMVEDKVCYSLGCGTILI